MKSTNDLSAVERDSLTPKNGEEWNMEWRRMEYGMEKNGIWNGIESRGIVFRGMDWNGIDRC